MPFRRDGAGFRRASIGDPAPVAQAARALALFLIVDVARRVGADLATFEPGEQPCTNIHGATYTHTAPIGPPIADWACAMVGVFRGIGVIHNILRGFCGLGTK